MTLQFSDLENRVFARASARAARAFGRDAKRPVGNRVEGARGVRAIPYRTGSCACSSIARGVPNAPAKTSEPPRCPVSAATKRRALSARRAPLTHSWQWL